ncbi:MAG: hypothetical protein PVJ57_22995 [Phycisphaerae bacterium]|jgi:hypothetical protein
MLTIVPCELRDANAFVEKHHRHLGRMTRHRFSVAVTDGERVVGVAIVGNPAARHLCDGFTLEVRRCCTDGTRNACSKLYAAAWRAARAMGYRRLITYTLNEEGGASLLAAHWRVLYQTRPDTWDRPGRPRIPTPVDNQPKLCWELATDN